MKVKVTDIAGNDGEVYNQAYVLDTSAPTKTIASATFSADTAANGGTNSDWITKTASQTVSGTLSANLASGETVYVSLDGGTNWSAATATVGQNTWTLAGQTLTGSNTLKVKVTDTAGNDGAVYNQAYVLDTSAPTKTIASAAFSADSAVNGGSIITKTAEQTVSGTLSANLSSGESVYVSLDNGASWTVATTSVGSNTWSLAGQTLAAGSNTLKVKVADTAGNDGSIYSQNYVLDTTAPTITSITRQTPTGSSTNADSLVYQVAFSEAVSNLDASDFSVAGTTASVTSVSQVGSSNVYNITVSGGDLADLNGTVSLGFSGTQNIQDIVGNAITNTTPTGSNDAKYDVINSLTVTTGDNKNDNATFSDYATDLTDGGGLSLIEAMHYASANQTVSFNLASDFVDMNGQTIELVSGVILDTDLMNGLTISNGTLNLQGSAIVTNGVGDSLTIASTITGNGQSLTKMGDGRLTLSSAINSNSSFSTNVTGGSLSISDNGNLGSGGLTLDGGSLILQNSSDISHDITLGANGGTITVTNSDVTVSGAISGSGALTHTGGRALTLSGNNTFSGGLTLSGSGGVVVADGGNLGGGAVTLSQGLTVTGSSIALANNFVFNGGSITNANNVTISGDISGSGSIEKAGAGTLLLSGAGNSWSGAATVSAGTLSGTTTSLTGDIVNNAAVVFNQNSSGTYSKIISGTGTFTKSGSGAVTLTGENTYTGNTIVSAGELVLNNSNGMALADTSAVALTGTGKLSLSSNETIGNLSGVSGTRVDLGANTLTVNQTNSSSFAGVMSGTGGLIKTGAGTLALSGANTYTGDTTISSGEVFASGGSAIADNSAVTVAAGATFELSTSTSETIGSIAGAGSIAANGGTLTVGGDNTSTTFSGVFSAGSAGAALAKVGSGTLTLSGNNTYSGNTTVSGGTLSLTGSLTNTSEVIVNSGATLAGSGSVFSANSTNTLTVNSGGFLAPGVSGINSGAGGLTVNGNLVLNGTLKADITGSTAKTEYDQVTVKGNVTLGANSAFDIAYSVTSSGNTFELIDNQGSSAITGTLNGVAEGGSLTSNSHSFQTSYVGGTGNDITLKDNAVPVISAVDVTGNLTEGGALTKNGSVTFSDADTTNRPTATKADKSITAKAQDGTTDLTLTADQIAALKAAFSISSPSSNTNTGTVNWSFNIAESSIDFLKQGETVTAVFSIIVTDDFNAKATQDVTVTITGTNDAPVITSGATGSVNENAPTSTVIYMATATDAENDTLTYSLTGADAALLNINPSTGAVTLKNSADYETKNTYSFNVVVTDNGTGNLTDSKAVAVSVNDLNDNAPVITSSATGSVNENAPTSTVIYQVTATDADGTAANNTLQYSLSGADANLLDINAVTGAVTLKASADFETKSSYSFNVIATDNGAGNLMGTKAVTVSVNDLNDNAPVITSSTTGSVNENAPTSTVIYQVTATDADGTAANNTLQYSLSGADANLLDINAVTGAVTLKASADFETKSSYSFNVIATDNGAGNLMGTKAVTVSVNDLNDNAPVITSSTTGSVNENAPTSTVIYQVTATDADGTAANNTLQYSLSGADANLLDINAVTGAVTLKASADFETKSSYSFNVIATDNGAGNLMGTKAVTVSVNDLNDNTPVITSSTTGSVNENAPTSTVIYQVTATDADGTAANNTLQYSLSGADANLLDINAVTGAVTLKASADFETKSSYSFNVIATDNGAGNLMGTKAVTVSVNDLNDNAPVITSSTTGSVNENAPTSTVIYQVTATDADGTAANNTLQYSLSGADANLLDINAVTGAVTLKASADFETKSSYSFNVIAIDNGAGNLMGTKAVTVSVNDLNDNAPTVSASTATATLVEAGGINNATLGTSKASITLTKADVDTVGTVHYDAAYLLSNGWSTTNGGLSYSKVGTYGTATLTLATDTVSYELSNSNSDTQALTAGQSVNDSFTIEVTDGNATQTTKAVFNIVGSNDAPIDSGVVASLTAISGQAFSPVTLPANLFKDLDSGETSKLVWRVENLPTGMLFNAETHTISGKPVGGFEGVNTLQIIATDPHGAEVKVPVTLTISPAPVIAPVVPTIIPTPQAEPQGTTVQLDAPTTTTTPLPTGTIASEQGVSGFAGAPAINANINTIDNGNINVGNSVPNAIGTGQPATVISTSRVAVDVGADGQVQVTPTSGVAANTTGLSIANLSTQPDRVSIAIADTGSASNYSATLSDGSTLPSWVQVDPVTGEVSMTPPPGQGKISLKINAVDANGNTRVLEVDLDLDKLPTSPQGQQSTEPAPASASAAGNGVTFMSLDEQLNKAASQLDDYGRDLMKLLVS
ncbi:Cadherin domain protein [Marinomonas spartinae]|nr:Cadherin domain protein [Marinomonas spartinae]